MPRYQFKGHRDLLAQVCYGVPRIEEVPPQYLGRLDIISMIEARRVAPAGLVVTKASDTHHHDVQLTLLRASALVASSSSLRLETIAAVDDSTGHTPLSFEQFRVRLLAMLDTE